jgi:hypothetical protein
MNWRLSSASFQRQKNRKIYGQDWILEVLFRERKEIYRTIKEGIPLLTFKLLRILPVSLGIWKTC